MTDPPPIPPLTDGPAKRRAGAHVVAGIASGVLAAGPTSLTELAILPSAIVFLACAAWTWRVWLHEYRRPLGTALLLFAAWLAAGLIWSPDRRLGLEEFGNLRFFVIVLLLIPALRLHPAGRLACIGGLAGGIALGILVQALHAWAEFGGGPAVFAFDRAEDRISGWWDPAVAGTILTAGLGLHLAPALMGRGRTRLLGIAGCVVTITGLLATGSRGGWLASAGLVLVVATVAVVRAARADLERSGRAASRRLVIGLVGIAAAVAVGGLLFGGAISGRIDAARAEITAAVEGDYSTPDGARLAMKITAVRAFAAHPVLGVGTGGYAHFAADRAENDPAAAAAHDHAHDTVLHLAASNGLVGVGLALGVFAAAGWNAWRWVRRHALDGLGSYHAGPLFALVGLALVTPFDTLHVSGSSAAVTGFVLALCSAAPRRDANG